LEGDVHDALVCDTSTQESIYAPFLTLADSA
jgi:hypothetical protein